MARREKIVTAGNMVYMLSYPVPKYRLTDTERQRGARRRETGQWRAKINRLRSAEKLEQLLFANFGQGDRYVTLTYRDECLPERREDVLRDMRNFRRRLRSICLPRGEPLRYIYAPEHKHGLGRWHIHLVLSGGVDEAAIRQCWPNGHADIQWYERSKGEELAAYLAKERPERVGAHPWITCRGLRRPEVDSRLVPDARRLIIPPGAVVKKREQVTNSYGEFEYVKYYLPEQ